MLVWILLVVLIFFVVILYLASPLISPTSIALKNAHVLVTGGSSGIGKCLATLAVERGARVTIVARDEKKLKEAEKEISSHVQSDDASKRVQTSSVDLSNSLENVQTAFDEAESTFGPVSILINCAGTATPGCFDEVPIETFQKMMSINYLSTVHATRALLPGMKARSTGGRIVFVSSQAGQLGLFGFSAYSASKFALRGLAESLQMEVAPYNIHLTLAFPPDTNTPGFQEEQKSKPEETKLISESSGLFHPQNVAASILDDTVKGRFFSSMGLDGMLLANLTSGFSPVTSLMEATQQVLTMGLFRIVSLCYLRHFMSIVQQCKLKRDARNKTK